MMHDPEPLTAHEWDAHMAALRKIRADAQARDLDAQAGEYEQALRRDDATEPHRVERQAAA